MQDHSQKCTDDLIQGIKGILSKNRCSFSSEEQVLLERCVEKLEALESEPDVQNKAKNFISILGMISKVFTIVDHFKDLF